MKILLIEDRLDRLRNYTDELSLKNKISRIVTEQDFIQLKKDFDNKNFDEIAGYDCVMCHRSALTMESRAGLIEKCAGLRVPIVFFSGSISANRLSSSEPPVLYMNSRDFYSENIHVFLDNTVNENEVNLSILQFGQQWKLNLLLNTRKYLLFRQRSGLTLRIRDLDPMVKTMLEGQGLTWLKENSVNPFNTDQLNELHSKLDVLIFDSL